MFDIVQVLWLAAAAGAYLILQSSIRFRRIQQLEQKYGFISTTLGQMTDNQAFEIQKVVAELEFPTIFEKALQFALFRTYGIPSISKLLVKTKQLSTSINAPKRYSDTVVLVNEIYGNPPSDTRTIEAFGRLNYLHGQYRESGQILDSDMLYTLNLFAWEPIKWIDKYEWRTLTDMEKCAIGTFVKSMGDAMEISYEELPSYKTGWQNGLHWLQEVSEWSEEYEKKNMVPCQDNHETAEETTAILVRMLPASMRSFGATLVNAIMDDRLRKAMMYEKPSMFYKMFLEGALITRKNLIRYVFLPRPEFMRRHYCSETPNKDGRYYLQSYDAFPFYVKPTFLSRWGLTAWIKWITDVPLPGDAGELYQPKGYKIEEIGPKMYTGKGSKESQATQEKLHQERTGGCPFMMKSK